MLAGLARPQKAIPPRFFYDEEGSRLFEEICGLAEYYPPRVELAILAERLPGLAARVPQGAAVIGLGSARGRKVRRLVESLRDPAAYVAIDISRDALLAACRDFAETHPRIQVVAVWADYMEPFELPAIDGAARLVYFPGSTIGNLHPYEARDFLRRIALCAGSSGRLLLGVDLKKDPGVLHAAYNDSRGVTALFNLNVIVRANRELGADFDLDAFAHRAFYDASLGRIEMHLVSRRPQEVRLAGATFTFSEGETIHTECSYKYTVEEVQEMARGAGFRPEDVWVDERRLFSVHELVVA